MGLLPVVYQGMHLPIDKGLYLIRLTLSRLILHDKFNRVSGPSENTGARVRPWTRPQRSY